MAAKAKAIVPTSTTVRMDLERETKNTVRYAALDENASITTIYVGKDVFGGDNFPQSIDVTVAAV